MSATTKSAVIWLLLCSTRRGMHTPPRGRRHQRPRKGPVARRPRAALTKSPASAPSGLRGQPQRHTYFFVVGRLGALEGVAIGGLHTVPFTGPGCLRPHPAHRLGTHASRREELTGAGAQSQEATAEISDTRGLPHCSISDIVCSTRACASTATVYSGKFSYYVLPRSALPCYYRPIGKQYHLGPRAASCASCRISERQIHWPPGLRALTLRGLSWTEGRHRL